MLSDDIHLVEEFVKAHADTDFYNAPIERIKTALAELGTTPNTGSPKLPSVQEIWKAFSRKVPKNGLVKIHHPLNVIEYAHNFIARQLRTLHGAAL